MTVSELALIIALVLDIALGVGVFFNHSRRATNQFFFALSIITAFWLLATWSILHATEPEVAMLSIKSASAFAALIPLFCHLIRLAITNTDNTGWHIIRRARYFISASVAMVILCFSDLFLNGVVMPQARPGLFTVVEPIYGPAYFLLVIYLMVMMVLLIAAYIRDRKNLIGRQRTELDFVVLGAAFALLAGTLLSPITAIMIDSSRFISVFNALSIMLLNSIVAYGIAAHSIMGIASFLRKIVIYLFITIYLSAIYLLTWHITKLAISSLNVDLEILPYLLAALAAAFSMRPAHGWFQIFANRLLFSSFGPDDSETIRKANLILQSISTVPSLLDQFVKFVSETMGTNAVSVLLKDDGYFRLKTTSRNSNNISLESESLIAKTLANSRKQRILVAENIQRYATTRKLREILNEMRSLNAVAIAGVYSKSELIGMIVLGDRTSGGVYDGKHQETLKLFTNQMAIALENAKLYTHVQNQNIYMQSLLENLVNGVVAVDSDRNITVCNSEAERILRVKTNELKAEKYECLPKAMQSIIADLFENGKTLRNRELVVENTEGEPISLLLGGTLISGHGGGAIGALLVFNDQTKIKQLESQVRRSERLASAGQLAAGMAHEIKNPLVTIKTFAELLPIQYEDEEFRTEFSELVGEEIGRIDNIVNQLLDFARPAKPHFETGHIHAIIDHSLKLLDQEFKKNNLKVRQDLTAETDLVRADAKQLHQVFVNLILNAIAAMKNRDGVLTIHTKTIEWIPKEEGSDQMTQARPFIKIDFSDTGCGMEAADIRRIFDPFYTTHARGSGMGLAVAHSIVADHSGRINVLSTPEIGTTFSITLPITDGEGDE